MMKMTRWVHSINEELGEQTMHSIQGIFLYHYNQIEESG